MRISPPNLSIWDRGACSTSDVCPRLDPQTERSRLTISSRPDTVSSLLPHPASMELVSPLATSPFPAGLQVLLLEDGGDNLEASALVLLHELHYHVTHAPGPQQAAALLQHSSSPFDVVLADAAVLGPDLGSPPACEVFEAAASCSTPIVLLMGQQHSSTEEVMAAVQAGAADVLERPLCHSKLANLWQHTVRASLGGSNSKSVGASQHSLTQQHQQQQQPPPPQQQQQQSAASPRAGIRAAAAAAGAPAGPPPQHSPMCFGLLGDDLADGVDGLGGLELPPLVPSQLELDHLDSMLSDLHAEPSSAAGPLLGSLTALLPSASPSNSNAATAVAASLFGSSSEQQQCSSDTQGAATAGEMESCADAPLAAGSPLNRRRKLRACTSLRAMSAAAAASGGTCAGSQWPGGAAGIGGMPPMGYCPMQVQPGDMSMHMHMNLAPAGMMGLPSSSHWGTAMNMGMGMPHMPMPMNMMTPPMHGQLPRGMVWGMPMHSVTVAPGIVPAASAPAGQQQGSAPCPTLATAVAPAVQQQLQQQQQHPCGMPVPMWGAGMWAGGVMWGPMCPPGMLPARAGLPAATPAPALSAAGAQGVPQFTGAAQPTQTGPVSGLQ